MIIMKMFDEKFKLTHVWVYTFSVMFIFLKDYSLIGYLPENMLQKKQNIMQG